jgi:N-dimethylarginine dimethylaminohydrolase
VEDPDANLLLEVPDRERLWGEYRALGAAYEAAGVRVHRYASPPEALPNLIFARDLYWVSPEGAVVGRMAGEARAGEERFATRALVEVGVPIRATVGGGGRMEGADLLWLDEERVLFGVGRSDREALEQLQRLFPALQWLPVPVPEGIQHLLGAVNFWAEGEAAVHPAAGPELRETLERAGVRCLFLEDPEEVGRYRALNFVTLSPRKILMPDRCPRSRRLLEARGVQVEEVPMDAYRMAAGGPGCLTGILHRSA